MIPGNAPAEVGDQRRLHLWRDQDLNADTNALADAVAESDVDLFNLMVACFGSPRARSFQSAKIFCLISSPNTSRPCGW
jgi:hypothetical protein